MRAAVFAGESAGKMGFFLPYPDYIDSRALLANVAETQAVPADARFVVFSATDSIYVNYVGTATVPGDVVNGSASELNPSGRVIEGLASFSVIAPANCVVSMAFYK